MRPLLPRVGRRLAAALLAPLLVAAFALTGLAAPAQASAGTAAPAAVPVPGQCRGLDLADRAAVTARAKLAQEVFVGRVLQITVSAPRPLGSSMRVATYAVVVDDVIKGDLTAGTGIQVTVGWPRDERVSTFERGATYLFFVRRQGAQLLADRCEGSQLLPDGLGEGQRETLLEYLHPEKAAAPIELTRPEDGAGEPPKLGRVLAPGAAISLFGLLGLIVVIRLGRARTV